MTLIMHTYVPFAVTSVLITRTVSTNDDGLLRTSSGCTIPTSSLTLYDDWSNLTVTSIQTNNKILFSYINNSDVQYKIISL